MKKQGIIMTIVGSLWLIMMIVFENVGSYQFERDYLSYWNLAEKASTIQQKALYMDKFTGVLKGKGFEGDYNAIFFKTPDNSFDKNFEALQSLKNRLDQIQKMNIASFEYQTAIQQITAQEQGEAHKMLDVFAGIWWKQQYVFLWNWISFISALAGIFLVFWGIIKMCGGFKKVGETMRENEKRNRQQSMS